MAPPSSVPTVLTGVHGREHPADVVRATPAGVPVHPAGTCDPRPLSDVERALLPGPGLPCARAGGAVVRG
ncbi:hypothetical protein [Geodermatophilus maliterrae]|uniref:Uncharacterized protein n=1 Tax=Geodermatophilus maliterrae TaxID=3162531 RepID=A0ABV3XEY9_9ACTN